VEYRRVPYLTWREPHYLCCLQGQHTTFWSVGNWDLKNSQYTRTYWRTTDYV